MACWWASISPGMSVRPPRSITRAASGGSSPAPAIAAMRPSSTSTETRSRTGAAVPSNSRAFASQVRPAAAGGSLRRQGRRGGISGTVSEPRARERRLGGS